MLFSLKNLVKGILFVVVLGGFTYYVIGKIQYRNNLMDVEEYSPISTLIVPEHEVKRSKYPFVDIHNHQFDMPLKDLSKLVAEMDSLNMAFMVNLSGFRGVYLKKTLENVKENAPSRFGIFVNLDFEQVDSPDFVASNLELLKKAKQEGAIGLKVYKSLGLTDKDSQGNRIAVNDPKLQKKLGSWPYWLLILRWK